MQRWCPAIEIALLITMVCGSAPAATRLRNELGARRHTRLAVGNVRAGGGHTCVVMDDGTVRCWGDDSAGELGDGTITARKATPVTVTGLSNVVEVAVGTYHTCALLGGTGGGGTVRCWGDNSHSQLGNGSTFNSTSPVGVSGIDNVVAIAAGEFHTCALRVNSTLWCWGENVNGQLGFDTGGLDQSTPGSVPFSGIRAIAAAGTYSCAISFAASVLCWGELPYGLGDGVHFFSKTPVSVQGVSHAVAVAAAPEHACVLIVDGTIACWGNNASGELGDGTTTARPTAVVPAIQHVTGVSTGERQTCATISDGTAHCWGYNGDGEVGDPTDTTNHLTPGVAVTGLSNAVEIGAGSFFSCALDVTTTVRCWGSNGLGSLGTGTFGSASLTAVPALGVTGNISAVGISSGGSTVCARRGNGVLSCWGNGNYGELGNPNPLFQSPNAVNVVGVSDAFQVAVGYQHVCAVRTSGTPVCWGNNTTQQLGSDTNSTDVPGTVLGIADVIGIAAGTGHSCAHRADGTLDCWGDNSSGQIGSSFLPTSTLAYSPTFVTGIHNAISVSAGASHTCAVLVDGTAWCWGDNTYGQLGDNNQEPLSRTPVQVSGLTNVLAISASLHHTCAVTIFGTVYCWGENITGQLGIGSKSSKPVPALVSGISNAVAVMAGEQHTCAALADGSAFCWGSDARFQLGSQQAADSLTPVPVIQTISIKNGLTFAFRIISVTTVAGGYGHTCALQATGLPLCWGNNLVGQIGDGTNDDRQRPTIVNSFTANVSPAATLAIGGRFANVSALINCPADGMAHVSLTLSQGAVSGYGTALVDCAGGLIRAPISIAARGAQVFQPGSATADVESLVRERGVITEDQHWSRSVILQ